MDLYSILQQNAIYVILIISLMIWTGIGLYLFSMSSKLSKLEKDKN
jgi:CcmD family protein